MIEILDKAVAANEGTADDMSNLYSLCVQGEKWFDQRRGPQGWAQTLAKQVTRKRQQEAETQLKSALSTVIDAFDEATVAQLDKASSAVLEFKKLEATSTDAELREQLQEAPSKILDSLQWILNADKMPELTSTVAFQNLYLQVQVCHCLAGFAASRSDVLALCLQQLRERANQQNVE